MKNFDLITERQAILGFSYFGKIGPANFKKLLNYFPNLIFAFKASGIDLEQAQLKSKIISEFIVWRNNFDLNQIEKKLDDQNINYITLIEENYPFLLKEISDAPYILFYRGHAAVLSGKNINRLAVVGSRKHSAYATKIISEFLPTIIENKIEIVSGLALGVDALAHKSALNLNGITIAVLGCGIDKESIYPPLNRTLAEEIVKNNGLLISEFPPGTKPLKQNFPQRNRIISGLCQATLVVEAQNKSGALITAYHALDQNRDVLSIPGNIFSEYSMGTNKLLKAGAKVILGTNDILETFKIENSKSDKKNQKKYEYPKLENIQEKTVYELIKKASERSEKISADDIIKITKIDTAVINSILSILELRGIAKSDGISYDI